MPELTWSFNEEFQSWEADVQVKVIGDLTTWRLHAYPRPSYCDRGQWLVMVSSVYDGKSDGWSPLDDQEGFPRYYFSLENMKSEMQLWVNKRQEVKEGQGPEIK